MRIAVIIPTRNEAANLPRTVQRIRAADDCPRDLRIVVSDCQSDDDTISVARDLHCDVIADRRVVGRGDALHAGVASIGTDADVLWFVHADTLVPRTAFTALRQALADEHTVGGAFTFAWSLDAVRWLDRQLLRAVTVGNRVRYRITRHYFGDQAIFVRREALERIGGMPKQALLEDVELCRRLKRIGRLIARPEPAFTSPRRYVDQGVIRELIRDCSLLAADRLSIRPVRSWASYNEWNAALASPTSSSS
ncbi:MAG: glycosyltransferase [Planctomycetota bacterium]